MLDSIRDAAHQIFAIGYLRYAEKGGNLVGSNVFNILSVLGATALINPIAVPGGIFASGLIYDYLVMLFTSALPWVFMRKTYILNRNAGIALLGCYVCYIGFLLIKL